MPFDLLLQNPIIFITWLLAIIVGITVHEYSHVLSAYLQGDSTGKDLGRLSLNPLVHIDVLGLLLLIIARFGWGKPAPFNPYNLRNRRWGPVLVALAGPFSNLVATIVFAIAFRFLSAVENLPIDNPLAVFLQLLVQINIVLMLFNLLPIPPLDGSRLVSAFFGTTNPEFVAQFERIGPFLLLGLILFGGGLLGWLSVLVNRLSLIALGG